MGSARATIEFGSAWHATHTAGKFLEERFGVPRHALPLPLGVTQTDRLFEVLEELSGRPVPAAHVEERGRLVDSYVDAHKYVFGKRAVVYGEQDLVVGIAALLAEIGIIPALCASGTATGRLREQLTAVEADLAGDIEVLEDVDFAEIEEHAIRLRPDLVVGNSKGYALTRRLSEPQSDGEPAAGQPPMVRPGIPGDQAGRAMCVAPGMEPRSARLVRVGFPIHDRIDGPRLLHLGYRGAQQLFDRIANALIEASQDASPVGYSYM